MNGINLIPPSILEIRGRRRRLRIWSFATAGYALVLAGSYGAFASGHASSADTRRRITELTGQIEQERAGLATIRDRAAEAHREADAARMMAGHPDWSVLLALLASPLSADMSLETCQLSRVDQPAPPPPAAGAPPAPKPASAPPQAYTVSLTGLARTQSQVTTYALTLERLGDDQARLFETVTLVEAKGRRIGSADVVSFRIECRLAARAAAPSSVASPTSAPAPGLNPVPAPAPLPAAPSGGAQ